MERSTSIGGPHMTAPTTFAKNSALLGQASASARVLQFSRPATATSLASSKACKNLPYTNRLDASNLFCRGHDTLCWKLLPLGQKQQSFSERTTCRYGASQEALPAPPESWPIDPPLQSVEHERYMYPADTLPGYVKHSKDPRMPVKVKTSHLHIRGAVGCFLCHWMGDICSQLKLDGWVKELDDHNMEIVVSGPSTAIDWLVGTCYRHPPDAKVFQVVESPYYEPIEKGFKVMEIDRDWVEGGHEEMRGTATFDFFGEENMEMLWDVMWQEPDRLKREVMAERAREQERAKAEAAAELDRRLREREVQQVDNDYSHSMLVRAMQDEGTAPTLDGLTARSFRTIEADRVRKASVAPGGLYSIDDDNEVDLLEAGAMSEEELYESDGVPGGSDDDDSTLQALIDSISKTKQPPAKRTPRRRGAKSAATEEDPPEGVGVLGESSGGTRSTGKAKRTLGARKRTATTGPSEDDSDDFFADLTTSSQEPLDGVDAGGADVSGAAAAAAPPKPKAARGRPRKVKPEAEGPGVAPGVAAPKAKRGRRKQAAAQSVEEPVDTSDVDK